jgi:hypothetical protein
MPEPLYQMGSYRSAKKPHHELGFSESTRSILKGCVFLFLKPNGLLWIARHFRAGYLGAAFPFWRVSLDQWHF